MCSARRRKTSWIRSATAAEAEQREYTADEYYKLLDGLRYEEVVNYTDPTGDTAKTFENRPSRFHATAATPAWPTPRWESEYPRGKTDLFGPNPSQ